MLALAGGGLGWACMGATNSASADSPAEPQTRSNVNVTRLYNDTCGKCHGMDASGGGAGTKTLNTEDLFDQKHDRRFFDVIKKGAPDAGMEAYGGSLSDEEIWGLVVHIRELQAKALREAKGSPKAENGVFKSKRHDFRIETVVEEGLVTPWGIDWLPNGTMLVTNRRGDLQAFSGNKPLGAVAGTPTVVELGQGGLMDVAVHPDYAKNGWIYLSYTEPAKSGNGGLTKVVRGKIDFSSTPKWGSQQTIWEGKQEYYSGAGVHFGSKIVFAKGQVYFSVGERGTNMGAQSLTTPFGKVMRLNDDGSVPKDNPYVGTADAEPATWTYGHRNPQGLSFDLEGNLWDTEHGPRGGDELNLLSKGANYGWPVVAFSINYSDTPFRLPWPKPDEKINLPTFRWLPSIGASGLDVVDGAAFPNWKGDLVAGGLSGANLDRIRVKGGKLVEREELIHGMGRVREVAVHQDGSIYIALNNPHKIIRLVPNK